MHWSSTPTVCNARSAGPCSDIPVPGSVSWGRISTISQLIPVRLSATPSDIPHIPAPTISTFFTECIRHAPSIDAWGGTRSPPRPIEGYHEAKLPTCDITARCDYVRLRGQSRRAADIVGGPILTQGGHRPQPPASVVAGDGWPPLSYSGREQQVARIEPYVRPATLHEMKQPKFMQSKN